MYCDWPNLGRCCFCMPLRRGVLTFGYIHIFFSAFMIGIYSYSVNYAAMTQWMVYGRIVSLPSEICVAFYCFELVFDGLLIYGTHKKRIMYLKTFYYYTMVTCVATLIMQIVDITKFNGRVFMSSAIEMCTFAFAGLCLQIYLITMVRSLIRKLEVSGPHVYDNQLHQIVSGEAKVESNGIYNNTTMTPTDVFKTDL